MRKVRKKKRKAFGEKNRRALKPKTTNEKYVELSHFSFVK